MNVEEAKEPPNPDSSHYSNVASALANVSQISAAKNWGYAFILLAAASAFFLTLRLIGRAFIVLEFEVLVVYLPAVVCLLVYEVLDHGVYESVPTRDKVGLAV